MIGNSYRKRWNLGVCAPVSYVEGIGLIERFLSCNSPDTSNIRLSCMKIGNQATYPNFNQVCTLLTSEVESLQSTPEISIFLNPAANSIKIKTGNSKFDNLSLIDMLGRTVMKRPVSNATQLELHNLPAGVFILHFTGKGAKGMSRKVIVF